MENNTCQVCNHVLNKPKSMAMWDGPYDTIECEICGKYYIDNEALSMLSSFNEKTKLSAWIRDLHERGVEPPKINRVWLSNIEKSLPSYTPSQKQLRLLQNIERRTKFPGEEALILPQNDYPLAWASCEKELIYYLNDLVGRKLINLPSKDHPYINNLINVVEISALGWKYLDENSRISAIKDQAFVAMRFIKELEGPYENAIKKAIEDAGYKAYRIDRENHGNRIDVKIMAEIKNSRFVVADVTHQNQGVYFEAGYALGLGIPVIWSCRENDFENRHFDTKQYQHIKWESEDQLREELFNFICAIIGKNT